MIKKITAGLIIFMCARKHMCVCVLFLFVCVCVFSMSISSIRYRGWARQETKYSGHFNELLKTDRLSYSSIVQLVPLCSNFYLTDFVCFYPFGRFHFMIFCISEIVVQKTGSHYRHHQHFSATWMSDNQENEIMEQDFDIQLLFFEFVYGFLK